jgi:hypothetical protein
MANTSISREMESPAGSQWTRCGSKTVEEEEDCVFAGSQVYSVGGWGQDSVRS